jgi:hypothetical protein
VRTRTYAFDASSVRRKDADGRLHVETAHISAANVCPYYGREIPDWKELNLDPEKLYYLYRDPEELEKAAPTFNNMPILDRHEPITAETHEPDIVIGTTGTDATFKDGFLDNSLAFWPKAAIDDIESEEKRELSAGYRYRADMRPGRTPAGDRSDGVMRDLVGSHLALVSKGRAGPDVMVGDEALKPRAPGRAAGNKEGKMKLRMTPRGLMTAGALGAYLQPRLAADARIPVGTLVRDLSKKNLHERLPAIAAAVRHAARGRLGQDADLEDLDDFLDAIQGEKLDDGEMGEPDDVEMMKPESAGEEESEDDEPPELLAKIREFLKDHLDEEALAKFDEMVGQAPEKVDEPPKKAGDEPPDFKGKPEMPTKEAMDTAIAKAVKNATENAAAIRSAENAVRPWVGELRVAFDSAEGVYRAALDSLGVKHAGIHESALPTILEMTPRPSKNTTPRVAQDAAAAGGFSKRFPDAARISKI